MKVHISCFFSRVFDQKAFKKSCKGKAWFVHAYEGVWFFATESDAQDQKKKLKASGVFGTVHHVLDITF
jgi:hypothetical protein